MTKKTKHELPEDENRPWSSRVEPTSIGGIRYEPEEPEEIGDDVEIEFRRGIIETVESDKKFRHNSQLWF